MSKLQIISDKNKKSSSIKNLLLNKIKSNQFKKENLIKIVLEVNEKNTKAINFYISNGFTKEGRRKKTGKKYS